MFNTRSGFWMLISIGVLSPISAGSLLVLGLNSDVTYQNFVRASGFPMSVILPIIAILAVTGEWSQRSGLTTFTLVPSRGRVIGAKAIATLLVGLAPSPSPSRSAPSATWPVPHSQASTPRGTFRCPWHSR